jgi:hypothetical protein
MAAMVAASHLNAAKAWAGHKSMTWRWNGVNDFREIIRKLRDPRINEEKRRIIAKKTGQERFFKPISPLFKLGLKSRYCRVFVSNGSQTMRRPYEEVTYM